MRPGASGTRRKETRRKETAGSTAAAHFDAVVQEYASTYAAQSPGGEALRARQQRVLELLHAPLGRVLDVGCGPGVLAEELLGRGAEIWGLDAAPKMIEECRRRLGGVGRAHFDVGDATRLPFPDGLFDAVLCLGVIDHIPAYDSAIGELTRVVRQGGSLIVSFPNLLSPYAAWKRFIFYPAVSVLRPFYYAMAGRRPRGTALSFARKMHTLRSATTVMRRHGMEITSVVYYNFNVFLSPLDEAFPRAALDAAKRLETLRRGPLRWLGAGFLVEGRRV